VSGGIGVERSCPVSEDEAGELDGEDACVDGEGADGDGVG